MNNLFAVWMVAGCALVFGASAYFAISKMHVSRGDWNRRNVQTTSMPSVVGGILGALVGATIAFKYLI